MEHGIVRALTTVVVFAVIGGAWLLILKLFKKTEPPAPKP